MRKLFRRAKRLRPPGRPHHRTDSPTGIAPPPTLLRVVAGISQRRPPSLGREAAEVRGALDDTQKLAARSRPPPCTRWPSSWQRGGARAGRTSPARSTRAWQAVAQVGDALTGVGAEVHGIVADAAPGVRRGAADHPDRAADAAGGLQRQRRSQARRRGRARFRRRGRCGEGPGGAGGASSKAIMGTVASSTSASTRLRARFSRDPRHASQHGAVHRALAVVGAGRAAHPAGQRAQPRGVRRPGRPDEPRIEGEMRRRHRTPGARRWRAPTVS